jgi:chemotaxis protein methyltransferase CheR
MGDMSYEFFYNLTRERSGLILGDEKRYLIDGRLQSIALAEGVSTVLDLLEKLRQGAASEALIHRCVEAMTTHETSFFRDHTPFDQLSDIIIPEILERNAKKRSFRIWSAACSTGQEPYSIAMTINRHIAAFAGWNIEIVATDLTEDALSQARLGHYTSFEIHRGLSDTLIEENFRKYDENTWEVDPELKTWLKFRTHNLLDSYVGLGTFDIVFCRNVLIYFNRATKTEVLAKIGNVMNPEAYLVLGSAETVVGLTSAFQIVKGRRGIYQLPTITHAEKM